MRFAFAPSDLALFGNKTLWRCGGWRPADVEGGCDVGYATDDMCARGLCLHTLLGPLRRTTTNHHPNHCCILHDVLFGTARVSVDPLMLPRMPLHVTSFKVPQTLSSVERPLLTTIARAGRGAASFSKCASSTRSA